MNGDLYRFYDVEGRLLYIGISVNAAARASQHRRDKTWWDDVVRMDVEKVPIADLPRRECEAIRDERPLYNIVQRPSTNPRPSPVVAPTLAWTDRQTIGRYGALKSWANTVDRSERTRPSRAKSPGSVDWHLARLGPEFDGATDAQRLAAAESAKKAWYRELAARSAAVRRRGGVT